MSPRAHPIRHRGALEPLSSTRAKAGQSLQERGASSRDSPALRAGFWRDICRATGMFDWRCFIGGVVRAHKLAHSRYITIGTTLSHRAVAHLLNSVRGTEQAKDEGRPDSCRPSARSKAWATRRDWSNEAGLRRG